MAVMRLNHAVLYVRDVQRSAEFYADVLGFRSLPHMAELPGAAARAAVSAAAVTRAARRERVRMAEESSRRR